MYVKVELSDAMLIAYLLTVLSEDAPPARGMQGAAYSMALRLTSAPRHTDEVIRK